MTRIITARTRSICDIYRRALAAGEERGDVVACLSSVFDVQRPAIWRALRSGGVLPPYQPRQYGGCGRPVGGGVPGYSSRRRRTSCEIHLSLSLVDRVYRDPCTYCGVRGDLPCAHNEARP